MTAMPYPRLTYDDLLAIPDDGRRRELIDGEIIVVPAPGWDHGAVQERLFDLFRTAARASNAGRVREAPLSVKLSDVSAPEPDLLFIRAERLREVVTRAGVVGAPDLVLEIMSPSRQIDAVAKFNLYARHGIPEFWLVDPVTRSITMYELTRGRYGTVSPDENGRLSSRVIPGLRVHPDDIFVGLFDDEFGNDVAK